MTANDTNTESADETLALQALVWTLADASRAARLLDLTGLSAQELRASAGSRATLVAALQFLENHEPDPVACAESLDTTPARLVAVRNRLELT